MGFDPQGDPRWFITAAGDATAAFFGFRVLSDDRCEVPDPDEFNGALAAINARLVALGQEPVAITFYPTPNNENVKVEDYVKRFRDRAGIPLARSGNHLIHDLSFHTASIFLPPEIVRFKQAEMKFVEDFSDYLAQKYAGDAARSAAVRTFRFYWRMYQTFSIDNGTGLLAPALVTHAHTSSVTRDGRERRAALLNSPINWMNSQGQNSFDLMTGLITDLNGNSARIDLVKQTPRGKLKMQQAIIHLPTTQLKADLRDFTRTRHPGHLLELEPDSPYAREQAKDRLCRDTSARREAIDAVARELSPPNRPGWGRRLLRRFF